MGVLSHRGTPTVSSISRWDFPRNKPSIDGNPQMSHQKFGDETFTVLHRHEPTKQISTNGEIVHAPPQFLAMEEEEAVDDDDMVPGHD